MVGKYYLVVTILLICSAGTDSKLQCLNLLIKHYFQTNDKLPIAFILDENVADNLSEFCQNNAWPVFVLNGNETNVVSQKTNYIINLPKALDFAEILSRLRMNNIYWSYHVKFLIHLADGDLDALLPILKTEDVNALIVIENRCVLFKNMHCRLTKCYWNKTHNFTCCRNWSVMQNEPLTTYKAIYLNYKPYLVDVENNSLSVRGTGSGVEFQILNLVAELIQITIQYTSFVDYFTINDVYENGTTSGDFWYLYHSYGDIAIGAHTLTHQRSKLFYYTFPHLSERMVWCVPNTMAWSVLKSYTHVMDRYSALSLLALFSITSSIMYLYSRSNMLNICFQIYAILISAPTRMPAHFKYFLVGAVLMSVFFNVIFMTILTSAMSRTHYTRIYDTYQKLEASALTPLIYETDRIYLKNATIFSKLKDCTDVFQCLHDVAYKKNCAYAFGSIDHNCVMDVYRATDNTSLIYCLKEEIVSYPLTIYMRRGFPYYKKFTEKLLFLMDFGFVQKFVKDIAVRKIEKTKIYSIDMLRLINLNPIFFLLLYAFCIAFIVLLCELLVFNCLGKLLQ